MTEIVPQRLLLVLPTTAEFDSRTYRIASAAARRGHQVTVLGRWKPGLPMREDHPEGYAIIRVRVNAGEALPLRPTARRMVGMVREARGRRRPPPAVLTPTTITHVVPASRPVADDAAAADGSAADDLSMGTVVARRSATLVRRAASDVVRRASILLTIRSQQRRSRDVAPEADLVHGMAYMGIPVALDLAGRQRARPPVVYDARDIYMDAANLARMRGLVRWTIARAERRWARRADRVITVNDPYAAVMAERFGVTTPLVVMNCAYRYEPPEPRPRRFHDQLGLPASTRVILYQGGFSLDRGIEQLMAAIRSVDGAVLVLLGYGREEATYRAMAAARELAGRVHVLDAVAPEDLLDWVASADVVAMPIQPTTLNHRLTTPNKLFEAMAADVPVVASDLPGMAGIVSAIDGGLLVDPTDPAAIAAACRQLLDEPAPVATARRRRIRAAAHDTYNWEHQADLLFEEYGRLTGRPW